MSRVWLIILCLINLPITYKFHSCSKKHCNSLPRIISILCLKIVHFQSINCFSWLLCGRANQHSSFFLMTFRYTIVPLLCVPYSDLFTPKWDKYIVSTQSQSSDYYCDCAVAMYLSQSRKKKRSEDGIHNSVAKCHQEKTLVFICPIHNEVTKNSFKISW